MLLGEVYGLWFFDVSELDAFVNTVDSITGGMRGDTGTKKTVLSLLHASVSEFKLRDPINWQEVCDGHILSIAEARDWLPFTDIDDFLLQLRESFTV